MKKVVILAVLVLVPISGFSGWIEPNLKEKLEKISPTDTIRVIIHLKGKVDWEKLSPFADNRVKVPYLINFAQNSQKELLKMLDELSKSHQVLNINSSFWNSNIIIVSVAEKDVIEQIASHPDVAYITENGKVYIPKPILWRIKPLIDFLQWNIFQTGAHLVWALGYQGEGVIVGCMDSGTDTSHSLLQGKLMPGGWIDLVNDSLLPYDDNVYGHGTLMSGIICADWGYGMAPKAKIAMAKVFNEYGFATWEDIHLGFQWFAALCTLEVHPRIISNSWGTYDSLSLECWDDIWNLRQLGIIPIFAIGNGGESCIAAPGDYPTVLAVGANDSFDIVTEWSSRGPMPDTSPWNDPFYHWNPEQGLFKPDILAGGLFVTSTLPGGGLGEASGTSMSTPHLAGACALILQKYPEMTFEDVAWVITRNAFRHDSIEYPNNSYGHGRLDIYKAFINAGIEESEVRPLAGPQLKIFPNPSSSQAKVVFQLPRDEYVRMSLYDLTGRKVETLVDGPKTAGIHIISLRQAKLAAGIYFCSLETETGRVVEKLTIVK